jgi:hypothetical protein
MSSIEEIEKQIKEANEKEEKRKRRIAEKKYLEEKEEIKKRSFTSFGKLILSDEKSFPVISIPIAERFNKAGSSVNTITPGPIYKFENNYKYRSVSNIILLIYLLNYLATEMENWLFI